MVAQEQTVVSVERLQRLVKGQTVLNNLNAHIHAGEVVGLLGKNGAGKTTLMETLLGFGVPAFGQVRLWGEPIDRLSGATKQRIGYVPQQDELIAGLTGQNHLDLYRPLRPRWNPSLAARLCDEWQIPLQRVTGRLSVGERQKLSIVLALAHEPDLLVLDEPVASLDPSARRQFIRQLIEVAGDSSKSILFSSHIVSDIERLASRVWLLDGGTLLWQGEQDALKESVVQLRWASQTAPPKLDGVLQWTRNERQSQCLCRDWSEHKRMDLARHLGVPVEVEYLNLEEIFIALTGNSQ